MKTKKAPKATQGKSIPAIFLKRLDEEAERRGTDSGALLIQLLDEEERRNDTPMRQVTLSITAIAYEGISKKALRESLTTTEYLESHLDTLGQCDDVVPLLMPFRTVERLADAGEAACLDDSYHAIAEMVLGDLANDPDMIFDCVTSGFNIREKDKRAIAALTERWKREDAASKKGGQAK